MMPVHGWWGGIFMALFCILIILGIVFLVARLMRNSSGSKYIPQDTQDRAINILRERLAQGKISQDEYDEKMRVLKEETR